jgi:hypothetical protein
MSSRERDLELAAGRGGQLSAYRNLAKSRGVDLATVLAAAERNDLASIVELRSRPKVKPGRPGWGIRDPLDALALLAFKRHPSR